MPGSRKGENTLAVVLKEPEGNSGSLDESDSDQVVNTEISTKGLVADAQGLTQQLTHIVLSVII